MLKLDAISYRRSRLKNKHKPGTAMTSKNQPTQDRQPAPYYERNRRSDFSLLLCGKIDNLINHLKRGGQREKRRDASDSP